MRRMAMTVARLACEDPQPSINLSAHPGFSRASHSARGQGCLQLLTDPSFSSYYQLLVRTFVGSAY